MGTGPDQQGCEQGFRLAVEASLDGFWQLDLAANTAHFSQRWQAIAGFEPREHTATLEHWLERVHPEDRPRFETELKALCAGKSRKMRNEHRLRNRFRLWRWVAVRGLAEDAAREGRREVVRIAGSMTDQTERRMTDPLTGLPNREFFIEHLERRLEQARMRDNWDFAVLSVAIERFKMVNESLGYQGGDALPVEIASHLTEAIAQRQTSESVIARLNGAEFLVCLEGVAGEQEAIAVASDIYATVRQPFQWRRERVAPSAAMGVAKADESYSHPDELMRDADSAMRKRRRWGAAGWCVIRAACANGPWPGSRWKPTLSRRSARANWCCIISRRSTLRRALSQDLRRWSAGVIPSAG